MAAQYAFVMKGMTKSFPGVKKPVLSNISLQFYQGPKDKERWARVTSFQMRAATSGR